MFTIAGSGTGDCQGNGGPALAAGIGYTAGIETDGSGNIYIAAPYCKVIRKISPSGVITVFAGGGTNDLADGIPATQSGLFFPWDVAMDSGGNLYILDQGNDRVRKVDTAGNISTVAGIYRTNGYSGDGGPARLSRRAWNLRWRSPA